MSTYIRHNRLGGYMPNTWLPLLGMVPIKNRMCYVVDGGANGGITDFWVASDGEYEIAERKRYPIEGYVDYAYTGDLVGVIFKHPTQHSEQLPAYYFEIGDDYNGKRLHISGVHYSISDCDNAMMAKLRKYVEAGRP